MKSPSNNIQEAENKWLKAVLAIAFTSLIGCIIYAYQSDRTIIVYRIEQLEKKLEK
jgi:hypothetical protein